MTLLGIRTDKPEAELYVFDKGHQLAAVKWQAHLKLAETLNSKIEEILNKSSISYKELDGIAVFKGPGSFTGLRIGITVANTLAYSLQIPIVAAGGEDWLDAAVKRLQNGQVDRTAVPEYGAPPRVTKPRK